MISAMTISAALGGKRAGKCWMARCPAHSDRTPSLAIQDAEGGKVLFYCHSGCSQESVLAALRQLGIWPGIMERAHHRIPNRTRGPAMRSARQDDSIRSAAALAIWQSAMPAPGTPVETYLASRGLQLPPKEVLRFHPGLKHPSGGVWPCMVALVTKGQDGAPVAIHRTFLHRNGGSKAPINPQKMMLGPCGGGAIFLADPADTLMIGEGIESSLSGMLGSNQAAWAALSTSGLRGLDLPKGVVDVIVLADGDEAGEAAARYCALRWKGEGRRVRIARPPMGMDFNDMLLSTQARTKEGV
jgi:putative DNA primase/helicase